MNTQVAQYGYSGSTIWLLTQVPQWEGGQPLSWLGQGCLQAGIRLGVLSLDQVCQSKGGRKLHLLSSGDRTGHSAHLNNAGRREAGGCPERFDLKEHEDSTNPPLHSPHFSTSTDRLFSTVLLSSPPLHPQSFCFSSETLKSLSSKLPIFHKPLLCVLSLFPLQLFSPPTTKLYWHWTRWTRW